MIVKRSLKKTFKKKSIYNNPPSYDLWGGGWGVGGGGRGGGGLEWGGGGGVIWGYPNFLCMKDYHISSKTENI